MCALVIRRLLKNRGNLLIAFLFCDLRKKSIAVSLPVIPRKRCFQILFRLCSGILVHRTLHFFTRSLALTLCSNFWLQLLFLLFTPTSGFSFLLRLLLQLLASAFCSCFLPQPFIPACCSCLLFLPLPYCASMPDPSKFISPAGNFLTSFSLFLLLSVFAVSLCPFPPIFLARCLLLRFFSCLFFPACCIFRSLSVRLFLPGSSWLSFQPFPGCFSLLLSVPVSSGTHR